MPPPLRTGNFWKLRVTLPHPVSKKVDEVPFICYNRAENCEKRKENCGMAKGDYVYGALREGAEKRAEWEIVEDSSDTFWWLAVMGQKMGRREAERLGYVYLGQEGIMAKRE